MRAIAPSCVAVALAAVLTSHLAVPTAAAAGDPPSLYAAGIEALRRGQVIEAIEALRSVADADPHFRDVQLQLGQAYLVAGLHTAAKACFDKALAAAPGNGLAALLLGMSLHLSERHQEAVEALDRAVGLAPGNPHPLIYRGWSLVRLGRLDEAARDLDRAAGIAPREATLAEASAELALARGEPEAAVARLLALGEDGPLSVAQRIVLAQAQLAAGRAAQAVETIRSAIDPQHPRSDSLYLLAQAQLRAGHRDEGRRTLRQFEAQRSREQEIRLLEVEVNAAPENAAATLQLIELLLANGQSGEARLRWAPLARRLPNDARVGALGERFRSAGR